MTHMLQLPCTSSCCATAFNCCHHGVHFPLQTAIGHWSEMMFPLFSILRLEPAFKRPPKQFMLLHLKRVHLMEWARAVMSVALGVKVHETLPPMLMQQETDSVWTQIRKSLGTPFETSPCRLPLAVTGFWSHHKKPHAALVSF